jgi:Uma2 family endonuclease
MIAGFCEQRAYAILDLRTEERLRDYAEAGIPEYWIVNPLNDSITVLVLDGNDYREWAVFQRGEQASSKLLTSFSVRVHKEITSPCFGTQTILLW